MPLVALVFRGGRGAIAVNNPNKDIQSILPLLLWRAPVSLTELVLLSNVACYRYTMLLINKCVAAALTAGFHRRDRVRACI